MTSLIYRERGPWDIFEHLREVFGIRHQDHEVVSFPDRGIGAMICCPWCLSVWVGIGYVLFWGFIPQITFWLQLPFVMSAGAIWLERIQKGKVTSG